MANKSNKVCKNCENIFEGNFCNLCGQNSHTHKINFHYVVHEIQHSIFHVDGGIFYTIKELTKRPGNSIREFIEGKRVKHFKPVTYVIILSIIHSFLEHKINKNPFIEDGLLGVLKSLRDNNKVNNGNFEIFEWLIHHYSYTALLLIPIFSLSSWIAFKKSKYNYFENLTLNTFLFGQVTLIFIVSLPLSMIFKDNSNIDLVRLLLSVIFTFGAYFQFFNTINKFSRVLNTLLTYILFVFFSMILLAILVGITVF